MTVTADYALDAHRHGYTVVPPLEDGTKQPNQKWKTYQTVPPTEATVTGWYADGRRQGFGVLCGAASGHLEMLELEGRAMTDQILGQLKTEMATRGIRDLWNRITAGYLEKSPSGGIHTLLRCPTGVPGNTKLARTADGEALIETRGEGGYTILAPSSGTVHDTGLPWHLIKGGLDTVVTVTADELDALHDLCRTVDQYRPPPPQPTHERLWAAVTGPGWIDQTVAEFNQYMTWDDILRGFTRHHEANGIVYWTRPGKNPRLGHSATTNSLGTDRLIVFTSSLPGFEPWDGASPATSYDRFSTFAILHHQGDRVAAARLLRDQGYGPQQATNTTAPVEDDVQPDDSDLPVPLHWPTFWDRDISTDWLIEPLIPARRHVVLYAPAKMGKSLLALAIAVAAATGQSVLGQPAQNPINVVYLDLEMTEDDVEERLEDMGYGPDTDLTHLHYYSLPNLPPLNTKAGGDALGRIVARHDARLVIIDTMARVIDGEENSADTYRAFDMNTSLRLKAAGVAVLRLDHTGKDPTKGQRGSSEKVGYADVVWSLLVTETGAVTLAATHRRIGWVPEIVNLTMIREPLLSYVRDLFDTVVPAGTKDCADLLDRLGMPSDATANECQQALRKVKEGRRRVVVLAAVKYRRNREPPREPPTYPQGGNQGGNQNPENTVTSTGTTSEPPGTTLPGREGPCAHLFRDAHGTAPKNDVENETNQGVEDDGLDLFGDPL